MKIKSSPISSHLFSKKGDFRCAICGGLLNVIPFKNGYICDSCLQLIKTQNH